MEDAGIKKTLEEGAVSDDEKLWACLGYIFCPVAVFLMYFTGRRRSSFIRHHNFQSIFFTLSVFVICILYFILFRILILVFGGRILSPLFSFISAIMSIAFLFFTLLIFIMVILYSYWALRGSYFKIPYIYKLARRF